MVYRTEATGQAICWLDFFSRQFRVPLITVKNHNVKPESELFETSLTVGVCLCQGALRHDYRDFYIPRPGGRAFKCHFVR